MEEYGAVPVDQINERRISSCASISSCCSLCHKQLHSLCLGDGLDTVSIPCSFLSSMRLVPLSFLSAQAPCLLTSPVHAIAYSPPHLHSGFVNQFQPASPPPLCFTVLLSALQARSDIPRAPTLPDMLICVLFQTLNPLNPSAIARGYIAMSLSATS